MRRDLIPKPESMDRDDFRIGWDLLVAQPWGRQYRVGRFC